MANPGFIVWYLHSNLYIICSLNVLFVTVQDLYSFRLFQMLLHCWSMISLFTMLDKQLTDACFISPKQFCLLHHTKHCNLVRLTCRCFRACCGSDNWRQYLSPHNFVFLLKCKFAFVAQLEAGFVEQMQSPISAKIQNYVLTNPASSYQSRNRLKSIYMSVWPNCSVWCSGENKMFGEIKQAFVGCISSIVSKLIINQQCCDIWKRWKL